MAKSFHELSPRAQASVFVLLCGLTTAGAWQLLIGPERSALESVRARLTQVENDVAKVQSVATRLPIVQREVRALEVALQRASTPAAATPPVAATAPGSLVVDSRPAGARVIIDGREVGRTPLTLEGLTPGVHAIRIDLTGYLPITTTARVEPGARARVAVSLTSERPQR